MQTVKNRTFFIRKLLIAVLILSLFFISTIFVYQYLGYRTVEQRLDNAYRKTWDHSSIFYRLFSSYNEAEHLFQQFTLEYDSSAYHGYRRQLDTMKYLIDSLSSLSNKTGLQQQNNALLQQKIQLANQFAQIKKTTDRLVFLAADSLPQLTPNPKINYLRQRSFEDSSYYKLAQDTAGTIQLQDTVVKKRENLFKRIFNAKNDTLISKTSNETFHLNEIHIAQNQFHTQMSYQNGVYNQNLSKIKNAFFALRNKERALLHTNYVLLNNLRTALEQLKNDQSQLRRSTEVADFSHYKSNLERFRNQLIASLIIMAGMIILILFYHWNAVLYERKLNAAKDYASRAAEEKANILANVSHEVRTPINSLLGIIELMKANADNNQLDERYLNAVVQDISVINSSLSDILSLSKLEAGIVEIKQEFFSPLSLLINTYSLHRYHAQRKNITLSRDFQIEESLQILSVPFQIRQIVSNLINNAIKYTHQGEVLVSAAVERTKDQEQLMISVKDSGIGISTKDQQQIFSKYYVIDSKSKGSFGLGLYIAKLLTEQLNGSLEIKSEVGKGSLFTLKIPIGQKKVTATSKLTLADLPKDLKLLFVDDNLINIQYLRQLFSRFSHLSTFDNVDDALLYLQNNAVDLVITDMRMGERSGWEILRSVRKNPRHNKTAVFVLTSETLLIENHFTEDQQYVFDGALSKPFDEQEFVRLTFKKISWKSL